MRWSALILDETRRSLIARNLDTYGEERTSAVERVLERITSALSSVYPDAEVPTEQVQSLLEQMTNHPKDRHVLAAAVATKAPSVITANLKDFRPQDTRSHGVEAFEPGRLPHQSFSTMSKQLSCARQPSRTKPTFTAGRSRNCWRCSVSQASIAPRGYRDTSVTTKNSPARHVPILQAERVGARRSVALEATAACGWPARRASFEPLKLGSGPCNLREFGADSSTIDPTTRCLIVAGCRFSLHDVWVAVTDRY